MALQTRVFEGLLDSTEEVVLVPAPGLGYRWVITKLEIQNEDTASVEVSLYRYRPDPHFDPVTDKQYRRIDPAITLATNEMLREREHAILVENHDELIGQLATAVTTNEPTYLVQAFREVIV